ncbi:MAG: KH domain-containing protein [Deltaproteobacteria bacterium]|nr:KH domain-containing protein [Deltaproteobacteria bacterium]
MSDKSRVLIEFIVRHLVDHPEQVIIEEIGSDLTKIVRIKVGGGDSGKVIGRQGRTAGALRTILTASAAKENKRAVLEIIDGKRHEMQGALVAANMP